MSLIETDGLVLRTYSLAEADRIVVMLTNEHGIVRGVAKGAKRLKSKFGGCLEPFSTVRLTYFRKDTVELVSIRNIELLKSYFASAAQPAFLQKFSYLTDILLASTPPDDPNPDLYRMTRACLDAAAEDPASLDLISFYFELWLLRLGGYLPDWQKCSSCKRPFNDRESSFLLFNSQISCSQCDHPAASQKFSAACRGLVSDAQRLSPARFAAEATQHADIVAEVSDALRRIISNVIGRPVEPPPSMATGN